MRRHAAPKREVGQDPKYKDGKLAKFINCAMKSGKKSIAEKIVYGALDFLSQKNPGANPLELFHKVLETVRPLVVVKSRRVGGSNYQVPVQLSESQGMALSMRWILESANKRSGAMMKALGEEFNDALNNRGNAFKKREDVHRMAEANKAFAHYAW